MTPLGSHQVLSVWGVINIHVTKSSVAGNDGSHATVSPFEDMWYVKVERKLLNTPARSHHAVG